MQKRKLNRRELTNSILGANRRHVEVASHECGPVAGLVGGERHTRRKTLVKEGAINDAINGSESSRKALVKRDAKRCSIRPRFEKA